MTISLRYAARSDVGLVRQSNQDSGYAGPHLCILCDGMGGPAGGDIASAIAISHLAPLEGDSHKADELLDLLRSAVDDAHTDLMARSAENPDLAGLGTTCIAVMRSGNKLAMVHVGDSRAYLLRDGELTQVTTDHTFVEYLIETGRLTPEQARRHPQRSVLLRVLGDGEGEVLLDESIREAVPGDRWLLCSDGLSGPVTAATIEEILTSVNDPGDAAERLIDLALKAGGPDNVTAVIFDVVDDDGPAQRDVQIVGSAAKNAVNPEPSTPSSPSSADSASSPESVHSPAHTSPAAKAAALLNPPTTEDENKDNSPADTSMHPAKPRRLVLRSLMWGGIIVLLTVLAAFLGWRWTQTQYYVATDGNDVVIYQGIPQKLGPIELSHVTKRYKSPRVDELDPQMSQRLSDTVAQPSLEAAEAYVETTVKSHLASQDAVPPANPSVLPSASTPSVRSSPSSSPSSTPTP
ncbi:PP2C family protein-serine/threonine phosphatase [Actinomyces vulturis]|uniref:PP2C family protein-serine/threonine phosphatase n=1 Tax=Actinomyces vulturis TaxID=1857645 RepID=UPI0008350390|nr:PP2C family serine/threonine-protein phosphatase [Actinomyces vulturis]